MADASSKTSGSSSMQSPGSGGFSSAPVAPVVTRGGREWSKEPPKRRAASKRRDEEESEEEEGEEEEDAEEGEESEAEEEEADDDDDGEETGSDSDRDTRKKKPTGKAADANKRGKDEPVKREAAKDKKSNKTLAPPRRKPAAETSYQSDGSETSSQADTDDDMTGRGASSRQPPAQSQSSSSNAKPNNGGGGDSRTSSPVVPRERNSSMTLPSLSRAAMIHMSRRENADNERPTHANSHSSSGGGSAAGRADKRGHEAPGPGISSRGGSGSGGGSGGQNPGWRRDRSRSRSRERQEPSGGSRWNDNQMKDTDRNEDMGSSFSGEGNGQREDEPSSPGQDGQDVRIMFHGREIYADDLIGLRVAKTFVGHGRFLGQVVKFDEPTSLYTIVYADGDAEELSIENTIQILIQDEIERADPSVPPVSSGYRNDRIPDSPEIGSVTPASSVGAMPVAPLNPSLAPPPSSHHSSSSQNAMPTYPPRRSSVAISEREAQFVIGLFENHALPVLMRQGWRTQKSGSEQRFYAPPGNFRGAGHMFASALDVVELIAFDNELLSACFPQNVHSAILSLFPESSASASRKRGTSTAPAEPMDGYDSKRVRGGREAYGNGAATAPMVRAGAPGGGAVGPVPGRVGGIPDDRVAPPASYRPDDRERERGDRDGYSAPQRMPAPLASGERFPSGGPGRGEPSDGYRRPSGPGGDYRSMPLRPLSADGGPPPASTSSSRWGGPRPGAPDSAEYHHRRGYGDAPDSWHERDQMAGSGGYMGDRQAPGGYRGGEDLRAPGGGGAYYGGERGLPRGGSSGPGIRNTGPPGGPGGETHPGYGRYRESRGPQAPPSSSQYSPGPDSYSNRYPPSRGEPPAGEYRGIPGSGSGGPPPAGMQDRFARPLSRGGSGGPSALLPPGPGGPSGGRGFSMMDVDRNATNGSGSGSGGGSYEHHRMDRGRSPHQSEPAGPPPGSSGSYGGPPGHYSHHPRSASNGSQPNPAD